MNKDILYMNKDVMYTLDVYKKDVNEIEKKIKDNFKVKFLAYDQYELKVSFVNELNEEEESKLFEILEEK